MNCEFCGNDEAVVSSCLSCLTPSPYDISAALCSVLGGSDWEDIGRQVATFLGWDGAA